MADILGAAAQIGSTLINNAWADSRTEKDRKANYVYGELAADAADARTRALYKDFYSPQALMNQYEAAGLSPAMMFGGTPGQGGMSGAHGTGTAGPQTPFMPMSLVEAAQAAALFAQSEKTKEETKNVAEDTKLKELEQEWNEMRNNKLRVEFDILQKTVINDDGNTTSLYELAKNADSYDSFLNIIRGIAKKNDDWQLIGYAGSEFGQRVLRNIYISGYQFGHDISVLSEEKTSADFQVQVIKAMQNTEFTKLNAEAAVQWLKTNISTAELTATQKDAWNNMLNKIGEKNETARDIIIILGMLVNNAMSNWHMPNITNKTQNTTTNVFNKTN